MKITAQSRFFHFLLFSLACALLPLRALAQPTPSTVSIAGKVIDPSGKPIDGLRIRSSLPDATIGSTDAKGEFAIKVPASADSSFLFVYYFSSLVQTEKLPPLVAGTSLELTIKATDRVSKFVTIKVDNPNPFLDKVDISGSTRIANPSGGIENLLKTLPGVGGNNELSSQYTVRGGNFDENLVYINDIEVFRPLLVRNAEQEGLSIINPDLIDNLKFSAGGFPAVYGDKLSSVLDITYREPDSFRATFNGGFLGASASVGSSSFGGKLHWITGARYRSNRYLLNSLDVQSDYQPNFTDWQTFLTFKPNNKLSISYLSYLGVNNFVSVPESQETRFGSANTVLRLLIFFDGQEKLSYSNFLNAITAKYQWASGNNIKFIASAYSDQQRENLDIIGVYRLQELETDISSEDFGNVKYTLGLGGFLNHARNRLFTNIYNAEVRTALYDSKTWLNAEAGVKVQYENIYDVLHEYKYIDSADYSIPYNFSNREEIVLDELVRSRNDQSWMRYMAFAQNTFTLSSYRSAYLIAGARTNYWTYSQQLLFSPRVQFVIDPNAKYNQDSYENYHDSSLLKRNYRIRAAVGEYSQPPYYRELRSLSGALNPEIRAQRSWQYVLGTDYYFRMYNRTFKFSADAYYKDMYDVIPYEFDNVRIRYFATNNSKAYSTGVDFRLYGNFVEDLPSWFSFSLMKTAENLSDDQYNTIDANGNFTTVYPGYIPRPTDQRFRTSVFFQDYLKGSKKNRVGLTGVYASGLTFGPPIHQRYADTSRLPSYKRIDISFSRLLFARGISKSRSKLWNNFSSIWLGLDIFNAFGFRNTIAYLWVRDIEGNNFGTPRFLTSRRFNINIEFRL